MERVFGRRDGKEREEGVRGEGRRGNIERAAGRRRQEKGWKDEMKL